MVARVFSVVTKVILDSWKSILGGFLGVANLLVGCSGWLLRCQEFEGTTYKQCCYLVVQSPLLAACSLVLDAHSAHSYSRTHSLFSYAQSFRFPSFHGAGTHHPLPLENPALVEAQYFVASHVIDCCCKQGGPPGGRKRGRRYHFL